MTSIRHKLLVALLGVMALVMIADTLATYRVAQGQANQIFDYHLRQIALSVRDQSFQGLPAADFAGDGFDFVIQVWGQDGETLYYSRQPRILPDRAQLGFATVNAPDGPWRMFALQDRGETIEVAQPMAVRDRLAAASALRTLAPTFILLPALGLLIWFIVGRGLKPLTRLARSVQARTPTSLTPLDEAGVPAEVRPLVASLNALLDRLGQALDAQRAFVADAAHELRTPLAALLLQTEVAQRAASAEEKAAALDELKSGLGRTAHAVQQLLTLARQEPGATTYRHEPVDLAALARAVIVDHLPLAEAKHIDLGLAEEGAAVVEGDAEALRVLLANLVANALRYTPAGGRVDVVLGATGGRPRLSVDDSGPGIPAEERERVFDRFYRRADSGNNGEGGSGLGLAIVKTIAERHGARVALATSAAGGLSARVEFAPPADAAADRGAETAPDVPAGVRASVRLSQI